MTLDERDELVRAQQQVIGILFEIVKRQQANSDLDTEYFEMITSNEIKQSRMDEIVAQKRHNSETINRLLKQLET